MTAETREKRVALVTGGDQGIGQGIARDLQRRGWSVHVTYRQEAKGAAAQEWLGPDRAHRTDVTVPSECAATVRGVVEREGRLDALVHAVGPYTVAPLSETPPETFRSMLDGNLFSALLMVDEARPHLRTSGGSYLFFGCAGLDRWRARSVTTAYIAAKAALLVTVRGLAVEEARHGVRANMISPGFVPHEGAAADTLAPDLHGKIPLGRPARMDEVTGAAAWLLSDEASHVVGQNLEVAGGWML